MGVRTCPLVLPTPKVEVIDGEFVEIHEIDSDLKLIEAIDDEPVSS